MIRLAVAILAFAALTGCGVGVDDPDAPWDESGLAASSQQELTQGEPSVPLPQNGENSAGSTPSKTSETGKVELPQDPIPLWDGRPVAPPAPKPLPTTGPMVMPVPPMPLPVR